MTLPPLSVYVHLPWCVQKCPYCDFNSYELRTGVSEAAYIDALLRDLNGEQALVRDRPVRSLFLGGGTPSLFSAEAIARLLDGVRSAMMLATDVEITLEANPGAVEAERFKGYRAAGVNRLSIGIQSFRNEKLKRLGRVHDRDEAIKAVEYAREAGFENLNLDLMYALPDDERAGALEDLATAVRLEPDHLSWYQLTLEPNTAFFHKPPKLPEDETVAAIEHDGRALLEANGYERYEVSAYAKSGRCCIHNLNYWRFGDYIGIGAGAHGKLTVAPGKIVRRRKARNPRTYQQQAGIESAVEFECIEEPQQLVLEFMLGALRLPDGVSVDEFECRTGLSADSISPAVETAVERGWLAADRFSLKPTPTGLQFLNALLQLF